MKYSDDTQQSMREIRERIDALVNAARRAELEANRAKPRRLDISRADSGLQEARKALETAIREAL